MLTSKAQSIITANAVLLTLAIVSVALRLQATRHKSRRPGADDFLIIAALVRPFLEGSDLFDIFLCRYSRLSSSSPSSLVLQLVALGHPSRTSVKRTLLSSLRYLLAFFRPISSKPVSWMSTDIDGRLDPLCAPILVYHRRSTRQIVRTLFLWPAIFWHGAFALGYTDHAGADNCLAYLLLVCHILSGLAPVVQLDNLHPNDQLSSHVHPNERHRYPPRHRDSLLTYFVCPKAADESCEENWNLSGFRTWYLVSGNQLELGPQKLTGLSCTVASVARLAYTIKFVEVNITGNYAINFDSKAPTRSSYNEEMLTHCSFRSEHHYVVRNRGLRLRGMCELALLWSAGSERSETGVSD